VDEWGMPVQIRFDLLITTAAEIKRLAKRYQNTPRGERFPHGGIGKKRIDVKRDLEKKGAREGETLCRISR